MAHARAVIASWRRDYNEERSALPFIRSAALSITCRIMRIDQLLKALAGQNTMAPSNNPIPLKISILILGLFVLLGSTIALAEQKWHRFSYPNDHFEISVPEDWKELPDEVRTAFLQFFRSRDLETDRVYGFQLASRESLSFPRILITIDQSGRAPEPTARSLKSFKRQIERQREIEKERYPDLAEILKDTKWAEPIYDDQRHIFWISDSPDVTDLDTPLGLTGIVLTNFGAIRVHCYSLAHSFVYYIPLFRRIVESVNVEEEYQY